jgi:ATP adenylyltransferase
MRRPCYQAARSLTADAQMTETSIVTSTDMDGRFGRFADVLSARDCSRHPYNEVLYTVGDCVVTPTLGSIIPNWLLVIPRSQAINFVQWRLREGKEPVQLVRDLLAAYSIDRSRAIWFEHGAAYRGDAVGCGVDHAHIHVVVDPPFTFGRFVKDVERPDSLAWQADDAAEAYRTLGPRESYLIAGQWEQAIVAQRVEVVGSQYFRRRIADLIGRPETWNYRTHPHIENVLTTIETFGRYAGGRSSR